MDGARASRTTERSLPRWGKRASSEDKTDEKQIKQALPQQSLLYITIDAVQSLW